MDSGSITIWRVDGVERFSTRCVWCSCNGPHVNESFREGEFLELVGGRDAIWLHVASFLYSLSSFHQEAGELAEHVRSVTDWFTENGLESYPMDYVTGILEVLESAGIVRMPGAPHASASAGGRA